MNTPDTKADFLVWIHFGSYFRESENSEIQVFAITDPGKFFTAGKEVFANKLEQQIGSALQIYNVQLSDVLSAS